MLDRQEKLQKTKIAMIEKLVAVAEKKLKVIKHFKEILLDRMEIEMEQEESLIGFSTPERKMHQNVLDIG